MPLLVKMPENEQVVRHFGGYPSRLNVLDRKRTAVQRQLRRGGLGSYEPETQAALLALVETSPPPVAFFDIGAHIGLYTALMSAIFPPDILRSVAFEPTPDTRQIALSIAEANHLRFDLEACALSNTAGTAELYISDKAETSNSLVQGFRTSSMSVTVATETLDAYCLRTGLRPSVIKIDVETHEVAVLQGALEVLDWARPRVVVELLPGEHRAAGEATMVAIQHLGYHLYRFDADERGWVAMPWAEYATGLSHTHRDWILAPEPLDDAFDAAYARWSTALDACLEEQNILVDGGAALPTGWDTHYPTRSPVTVTRSAALLSPGP